MSGCACGGYAGVVPGYYERVDLSYSLTASTDLTTAHQLIGGELGTTIYLQSIALAVTTDNAALQTWETDALTPVTIAAAKASPGLGMLTWGFGATGFALGQGEGLFHKMSVAGMAGTVTVMGY